MTRDTWEGAILGAVLGSIVIPFVIKIIDVIGKFWRNSRPSLKLFKGIANQNEEVKIFVRDFVIPQGADLYSIDPNLGIGKVPNVLNLWADADCKALSNLFNIFGQIGKTSNIRVKLMSQDTGDWNCHVIIIGAQAQKCFDFYNLMQNVAYRMDGENIYDNVTGEIVLREKGYGYGIILKALNPFKTGDKKGIGILIGGFGALGTVAAANYFKENFKKLGDEFGSKYFGIIVRASGSAGEEAIERLKKYDKKFKRNWFAVFYRRLSSLSSSD